MHVKEFMELFNNEWTDHRRIMFLLNTKYVAENQNEKIFLENLLASVEKFSKEVPTLQDFTIQKLLRQNKKFDRMIRQHMVDYNKLSFKTLNMLLISPYSKYIDFPDWFYNTSCETCGYNTLGRTRDVKGWCWFCPKWHLKLDEGEFRYHLNVYTYDEYGDEFGGPEVLYADAMDFKKFRVVDENGYSTDEYLEDTPDFDE